MLRADNDKLRLRIKAMKEAQDSKDEQLAALRARTLCADFAGMDVFNLHITTCGGVHYVVERESG